MAADPAPDTTANPTGAGADAEAAGPEPRHLQPVPAEHPEPDEPAAQSTAGDAEHTDVADGEVDEPELFEDEPGTGLDLAGWLTWARDVFSPQSGLWSTRPLAPGEVVHRARNGQQLADAGPLRAVSAAHGYVSAAAKITLRGIEWLFFEHLARCVLGLVLLTAACLYLLT